MNFNFLHIPLLCVFFLSNFDYSEKQVASRDWTTERVPYSAVYQQIEYLNAAVIRTNDIHSDSAIYYYNRIVNMYHQEQMLLITNLNNESLLELKQKEERDQKLIKEPSLDFLFLTILFVALLTIVSYILQKKEQIKKEQNKLIALRRSSEKIASKEKTTLEEKKFISTQMEEQLIELIEKEKIYIDKNLSLQKMAAKLNTNTTYLSQYFNIQLKTNFSDYINAYRIKEACQLIKQDNQKKYSMAQIADMAGFGSLTTFYTTFKKTYGITPVHFQRSLSDIKTNLQNLTPKDSKLDE